MAAKSGNRRAATTPVQSQQVKYHFYLVQRLNLPRLGRNRKGFDQLFDLDMMGSTEFEYGAVPMALSSVRAQGELVVKSAQMTREGITKTVYFVGPSKGIEDKIADFRVWVSAPHLQAKEWTNFEELFTGKSIFGELSHIDTIAWWSLQDDIAWALDEETANLLLTAFTPTD